MILQMIEDAPLLDLSYRSGYRARRYRSTWPTFADVEILPGLKCTTVTGDDPSLPWMPDRLSDALRARGVVAKGASGTSLPSQVPSDGPDLYEGPIQRAFLDGLARDLRRGGMSSAEISAAIVN